jgi:predicted AAA+ superfamily ATPase
LEKELYRYNPWWEGDFDKLSVLKERTDFKTQLLPNLMNRQVVFLTGLRRIGKTSLMKLCIKQLLFQEQVPAKNIMYVSLDDYLLSGKTILEIVEFFRSMHGLSVKEQLFLFIDEITFCVDYEQQLKNLYDAENVKIIASSSSASLLKAQNGLLTGRSITFEVLPLNYSEYLDFKNIQIAKSDEHLHEKYFKEYLAKGGIPEYVLTNDDAYIRELMDNIIYKDIAAVHGIRQISVLKDYFLLLMERSGKTLSINKIAKVLGISTESSKRYFDLFCDTYIIYPVTRFGKLNEQLVSPKKIYCCDTGIRNFYTGERDWGAVFENYVFLRLKKMNLKYIYENTIELDFFSENKTLIECKFHDEKLSNKQQELFDKLEAKQKFIARNYKDVEEIQNSFL